MLLALKAPGLESVGRSKTTKAQGVLATSPLLWRRGEWNENNNDRAFLMTGVPAYPYCSFNRADLRRLYGVLASIGRRNRPLGWMHSPPRKDPARTTRHVGVSHRCRSASSPSPSTPA